MAAQPKPAAPPIIHRLVETFDKNLDEYHSRKNETELRREFLDKFFAALGWDVSNEKGYDESHKEVLHEFSVEVAGQGKKADYAFRTGADRYDFLVEAKKPSVRIESSQDAAFQLRRYGWSAKLPVNILTDFEHLAVYDCRAKPNYADKASVGRLMLVHYKEYAERWDEIVALLSPEAVRQGSFAKYAEAAKSKKGTADVDDAFRSPAAVERIAQGDEHLLNTSIRELEQRRVEISGLRPFAASKLRIVLPTCIRGIAVLGYPQRPHRPVGVEEAPPSPDHCGHVLRAATQVNVRYIEPTRGPGRRHGTAQPGRGADDIMPPSATLADGTRRWISS
jgi:hypothetical protein